MSLKTKTPEEYKELGNVAFSNGNYTKAIENYTKAIDANPKEPSYYANRAACYLNMKKFQKCIQDCDIALQINGKYSKAFRRKAKSLFCLGKFNEAIDNLEKAMQSTPDDSIVLQKEIQEIRKVQEICDDMEILYNQEKYKEASIEAQKAFDINSDLIFLKSKLIECLAKSGQAEKAVQLSNETLTENSNNVEFLNARIIALNYSGQTDLAKKLLQETLRMDPDNKNLIVTLKNINKQENLKEKGNDAFKRGSYDEAIKSYSEAIELDKYNLNFNSILYANRAACYMKQKKMKEALTDCNKAIQFNDKYSKAYLRRAEIKMESGDYEEALRDYQQVKQLEPNNNSINERLHEAQQKAKKASRKDYYKILGIEKNATDDDIKKAYRKLALKWHPDKHQNDSEEDKQKADKLFKDIGEAYSVLSDPQKRKQYEMGVDLDGNFGGFSGAGFDPNVIFETFFRDFGGDNGGASGFPFSMFTSTAGGRNNGGNSGFPGGATFINLGGDDLGSIFSNLGGFPGGAGGFPGGIGGFPGGFPGGIKMNFTTGRKK